MNTITRKYNRLDFSLWLRFLFTAGQMIAVTTVCTYIYIARVEKIRTKGGTQVCHAATPGQCFSLIAL